MAKHFCVNVRRWFRESKVNFLPYENSKSLGSRGSMVARLKINGMLSLDPYLYRSLYLYLYPSISLYIYMSLCICICICVCVCVCVYNVHFCIYTCIGTCIHIHVYPWLFIHTYVNADRPRQADRRTYTRAHTHTPGCTPTSANMHTNKPRRERERDRSHFGSSRERFKVPPPLARHQTRAD